MLPTHTHYINSVLTLLPRVSALHILPLNTHVLRLCSALREEQKRKDFYLLPFIVSGLPELSECHPYKVCYDPGPGNIASLISHPSPPPNTNQLVPYPTRYLHTSLTHIDVLKFCLIPEGISCDFPHNTFCATSQCICSCYFLCQECPPRLSPSHL